MERSRFALKCPSVLELEQIILKKNNQAILFKRFRILNISFYNSRYKILHLKAIFFLLHFIINLKCSHISLKIAKHTICRKMFFIQIDHHSDDVTTLLETLHLRGAEPTSRHMLASWAKMSFELQKSRWLVQSISRILFNSLSNTQTN